MNKKRMVLVSSLWLVFAAPKLFAADANEKPANEAAQTQPAATNEAADEEKQQNAQQENPEGSAVAKRPQVSKGQATRDLILTIVGLVAFIGLMAFLLRRPKDLDKYEKMYTALREEKEKRDRQKEQQST